MKKIPISLIIDDPAPVIHVYSYHSKTGKTADGRDLIRNIPLHFIHDFCDVIEKRGIKGKFSVVPMPCNCGDIINGIEGVEKNELEEWLSAVKTRVYPKFSIGPEMLSHHMAVDLDSGKALSMTERDWACDKSRKELAPYIAKALSFLKEAGFDSCGVTSPWDFGVEVEDEYTAAISDALYEVYGKKEAWYFLRGFSNEPDLKPWIAYENGDRMVVSIPSTLEGDDCFWLTINTPETSEEFISSVADRLITKDGKNGYIINALKMNSYPILLTHWQSLASNGLFTGLRVLDEVAKRINEHLSDVVEWKSFEEILQLVKENKDEYRVKR